MKLSLQVNPDNKTATWEQIKIRRDELTISPLQIDDGRLFDVDQDSFVLMEDAISEFDSLPVSGLDQDGKLLWKMADNQYTPCSKADLVAILSELRTKRACRRAIIQVKAEELLAGGVTVGALKDLSLWGLS